MSHFTTIELRIRDLSALRSACDELGLEVTENAEARGFGHNTVHGDLVIRLKGPYDVAVQRDEGGCYRLATDFWGGHVEKELGKDLCRLRQLYGVHKATSEAQQRGLHVRRQTLATGAVRLTMQRL